MEFSPLVYDNSSICFKFWGKESEAFSFEHHPIWQQRGLPIILSMDLVLCSLLYIQVTNDTMEKAFPL